MQQHTAEPVGSDAPPQLVKATTFYPADFCGNRDLKIEASVHHKESIWELVVLSARGSGCSFQWSMKPDGARRMAKMLSDAANEADRMALDLSNAQAAA